MKLKINDNKSGYSLQRLNRPLTFWIHHVVWVAEELYLFMFQHFRVVKVFSRSCELVISNSDKLVDELLLLRRKSVISPGTDHQNCSGKTQSSESVHFRGDYVWFHWLDVLDNLMSFHELCQHKSVCLQTRSKVIGTCAIYKQIKEHDPTTLDYVVTLVLWVKRSSNVKVMYMTMVLEYTRR